MPMLCSEKQFFWQNAIRGIADRTKDVVPMQLYWTDRYHKWIQTEKTNSDRLTTVMDRLRVRQKPKSHMCCSAEKKNY